MRNGFLLFALIAIPQTSQALIKAPDVLFAGKFEGFITPSDPSADGSSVKFTSEEFYSGQLSSFPLGKVDFVAGGPNSSYLFTANVEVLGPTGVPETVQFVSEIPLVSFAFGPFNAQALAVNGFPGTETIIAGKPYSLELTGITPTNSGGIVEDTLVSLNSENPVSGYLWGSIKEGSTTTPEDWPFQTTGGNTHHHHCHETPEPATWLLAVFAILGGIAYQWKRRTAGRVA